LRFLPTACIAALILASAPAVAQTPPANADTYTQVVAHGVVIVTPGLEIDVTFTPDGKFTALGGLSKGVWRIDGEKMCSTPEETMMETCGVYPAGKKSGDAFEISTPTGRVPVRIR
jgi:hypothetical protein